MLRGMYKKMTASGRAYYGISSQSGIGGSGQRVTDITNPNVFPRRGGEDERG